MQPSIRIMSSLDRTREELCQLQWSCLSNTNSLWWIWMPSRCFTLTRRRYITSLAFVIWHCNTATCHSNSFRTSTKSCTKSISLTAFWAIELGTDERFLTRETRCKFIPFCCALHWINRSIPHLLPSFLFLLSFKPFLTSHLPSPFALQMIVKSTHFPRGKASKYTEKAWTVPTLDAPRASIRSPEKSL